VITDDEVLRLFERADPARVDDDASVVDAAGYLDALRTRSSNVTIIEPTPTPTESPGGRRRAIILAAAAAAVVIVVGAVVLATRGDDDTAPITNQPTPTSDVAEDTVDDAAVDVARGFVEAYGALDAERVLSYLADDAEITSLEDNGTREDTREELTREELRLWLDWLETAGTQQMLNSCDEQSSSAAGTTVRCTYDYHSFGSDQLGRGPFTGSYFDLTVRDGEIVQATTYLEFEQFSPQMWSPFAYWMDANYPADADVMYDDPGRNGFRQTEESFQLWEQHLPEYVAAQIAEAFVDAYRELDADRVIGYLAADADITGMSEVPTPEGLRLHLAWLEAIGHQQFEDVCAVTGSSATGITLRCPYIFHSFGSHELGLGPFSGSYFDLTVRDGTIVRAAVVDDLSEFSPQMWDPFATWMDANFPADADVMYDDASRNGPRRTEESIQLWEQHIQEYVAAQAAET
jgi:hypothetical protein